MSRPGTRLLGLVVGVALLATAGSGVAYARARVPATADVAAVAPTSAQAVFTKAATRKTTALPAVAAVGPLFTKGLTSAHSCTASVVASPAGDVLVTAAHCVSGSVAGVVFAPGYANGHAPYGSWVVQRAYVSTAWVSSQSPEDDIAFLVVAPSASNATKASVQSVVGAETLATSPAAGTKVTVTGYAAGSGGTPIVCSAADTTTHGYATFDCGGYVGGTSGGPWVTATGQVVGVIGGLQQGGCVAAVSYSSAFTSATRTLLGRAVAGGTPDKLPVAGASGC